MSKTGEPTAKEEKILRDNLAIERTYLAKERTVLAYVRTGLAIIGVALFFYKFIDMEATLKTVLTAMMMIPGVFLTFYGLYKTVHHRNKRKVFVSSYWPDV